MYDRKKAYERKFEEYISLYGQDIIFVTINKTATSDHVGFQLAGAKSSSKVEFSKSGTPEDDMTNSCLKTEIKVLWKDIKPYLEKLGIRFSDIEKHIIEVKVGVETFHIHSYYLNSFNNVLVIEARDIS